MKKHSRWDQKSPPLPLGDEKNLQWSKWQAPRSSTPNLRNMDTQVPLDYSTENCIRVKSQINLDHSLDTDSNEERNNYIKQTPHPMMPHHWPMFSNYPSFPSSSRGSIIPFPPPTSWPPPGSYISQNTPWWTPGRPPPNHDTHSNEYNKKEKKSFNSFYMNSRHHKEQQEYYGYYSSKRYANTKNNFDKPKVNQFQPTDNFHYQKNMFKKSSNSNFSHNSKYSGCSIGMPFNSTKDSISLQSRRNSPLKLKKLEKFSGIPKQHNLAHSSKVKNTQVSKSTAEQANSKAFDIAANNLRQAYLATKAIKPKSGIKFGKTKGKISISPNITNSSTHKSVPANYSKEFWDANGKKVASTSKIIRSNSFIQQKSLSDNESCNTDTESESGESLSSANESVISNQNYTQGFSIPKLERRCSESCLSSLSIKSASLGGRLRSKSTSILEFSSSLSKRKKYLKSNLVRKVKGIVVEHLLQVDKNPLTVVRNNANGSKKLKQIIQTINNVCGSHYAMKLCNERDNLNSFANYNDKDNFASSHLAILPDDVIEQVKKILDMEANGKGNSDWDEVSLSIADLISGSIIKNQSNFNYKSEYSRFLESDIEILTPPPRTPATMITLADSDTDFHPSLSMDASPLTNDLFNSSSISPEMGFMSLSPPNHKLQTPSREFRQTLQCELQPQIIKRSLSSTVCAEPIMPILPDDSEHADINPRTQEVPTDQSVSLKENGEVYTEVPPDDTLCEISIPSALVQVKEERPSPISECGLCMHSARSPHTPQCGFSYNMTTSPVHLFSGPPRPLASSAQRPVSHLPTDLSCIFKSENSERTTFVSLENIDRPSSEERPKNPAPPDTTSAEPPSPLAIPSLHGHTSRQILFSDADFIEPPRPPPPPPLEHSPSIKMERRTPTNSSFSCFYMRPDCDRASHSEFLRSEPRRPAHRQMRGESREHHLYPMEAPYIPSIRPRTPQRMLNLFPLQPAPRCRMPSRSPSPTTPIRLPSQQTSTLVNVAVQTEPLISCIDKSTNVDIAVHYEHLVACNSNTNADFLSAEVDSLRSRVKSLDCRQSQANPSFQESLCACEDQIFNCITLLDKQQLQIRDTKSQLIEALKVLSKKRRNSIALNPNCAPADPISRTSVTDNVRVSETVEDIVGKVVKKEACENVSSSQEFNPRMDHPSSLYTLEDINNLENESCTSTSGLDMTRVNDDDEEDSLEFELFVKEEHSAPYFEEPGPFCDRNLPTFPTLPLSTSDSCKLSEHLHIKESDQQSDDIKFGPRDNVRSCTDDIIIMGDLSHRKMVLFSPRSPKNRNSSGSEHGYSLRSRGPPSESYDYNSDSNQQIKELPENENFGELVCSIPNKTAPQEGGCFNDCNTASGISFDSSDIIVEEPCFKKKRKRKTKKLSKKKRKKFYDFDHLINLAYNCRPYDSPDDNLFQRTSCLVMPKQIETSILTLKIVGKFIFTGCGDSSVRVYDAKTGELSQTYSDSSGSVTSLLILGEPEYVGDLSRFTVITGSDDYHIRIFDGKTATLNLKLNATEPITCLEHRWKYVFMGTEKGYCIKWNLKDKKLEEKIQFCEQIITCLVPHVEGGRKVLLVAAKTCPLMIRDAMTGLFLRSLEFAPFNVYTVIFEGNLLYAGGSEKNIYIYDFCSGAIKEQISTFSSISSLLLHSNNIIATCYDGFVRIINRTRKDITHTLPIESKHKMVTCSFLYKNQVIIGNKYGEVISCNLPCENRDL